MDYQFIKQLEKLSFVEQIWLFGSRARGDNQERSDIDLAINCPKAQEIDWLAVIDVIKDADTLLKIDCVRLDELNDTSALKKAIQEQGIKLYERI
jgi:predicted nucleotidyltransferase